MWPSWLWTLFGKKGNEKCDELPKINEKHQVSEVQTGLPPPPPPTSWGITPVCRGDEHISTVTYIGQPSAHEVEFGIVFAACIYPSTLVQPHNPGLTRKDILQVLSEASLAQFYPSNERDTTQKLLKQFIETVQAMIQPRENANSEIRCLEKYAKGLFQSIIVTVGEKTYKGTLKAFRRKEEGFHIDMVVGGSPMEFTVSTNNGSTNQAIILWQDEAKEQ